MELHLLPLASRPPPPPAFPTAQPLHLPAPGSSSITLPLVLGLVLGVACVMAVVVWLVPRSGVHGPLRWVFRKMGPKRARNLFKFYLIYLVCQTVVKPRSPQSDRHLICFSPPARIEY